MSITQILNILRARAAVVLITLLVTTATALGVSLLLTKQYTTSAAVVVDVKSLDPVAGTILPGMLQPGYMSTQLDIINSLRVAERVVKMLGLEQDAALRQKWMDANKGEGEFDEWAARNLLNKLDARPSRDSNVIQIGFTGQNPKFVAAVANAFAQAFVDIDLDLKIEPARRYATWFEDQSKQARAKLEEAQKRMSAYQQSVGIIVNDDRLDAESNRVGDITHQLTYLQADIADGASKRASPNAAGTNEAMQNPVVAQLKSEIARQEAKLQEDSNSFGARNPQILRQQAQIAALKTQLTREVGQVSASFNTTYQINKEREKLLQESLAQQKVKVLELSKQRDEYNVMRRDVDTAQREYDLIAQRLAQSRLESRSSQTNISILSNAPVPLAAAKPKVLINTIAGAVGGALLGLAFALLLELGNRRIRSATDLALAIDVPVLATIASVRRLNGGPRRVQGLLPRTSAAT